MCLVHEKAALFPWGKPVKVCLYYFDQFPRVRDSSFTGVTVEECRVLLSGMDLQLQVQILFFFQKYQEFTASFTSFISLFPGSMQQSMDEEKKGLWKTIMERFSSKSPEDVPEKAHEK